MKIAPKFATTLISLFLFCQLGHAQTPTFQNQAIALQQASISESAKATYTSKDGLFQIGVGFPFPDPGEVSGFLFKEGEIKIRYFDCGMDRGEAPLDYFNQQCDIFDTDTLKNLPGHIVSKNIVSKVNPYDSTTLFAFEDGRYGIERHLMRKKRIYVILAVVNEFLDQPVFQHVVESFDTTADVDPDTALKARMNRLTWRPYPQVPEIPGQHSDLVDYNMKGQVAKTIDYYTDEQGNKAGIHYVNEYDRRGYNVRAIKYDRYGLPYEIEYSGFLDGKEVTKIATVNEELTLFKSWDSEMPRDVPENYDPTWGYDARYLHSTSKTYQGGKLTERTIISGAGKVWYRWVYEYKLYDDSDGLHSKRSPSKYRSFGVV